MLFVLRWKRVPREERMNGKMEEFCEPNAMNVALISFTCSIDYCFCRESQKYFFLIVKYFSKIIDFSGNKTDRSNLYTNMSNSNVLQFFRFFLSFLLQWRRVSKILHSIVPFFKQNGSSVHPTRRVFNIIPFFRFSHGFGFHLWRMNKIHIFSIPDPHFVPYMTN